MVAPEDVKTWQRNQLLMYHALFGTGAMPPPPGMMGDQVSVGHGDTDELASTPGAVAEAQVARSRARDPVEACLRPRVGGNLDEAARGVESQGEPMASTSVHPDSPQGPGGPMASTSVHLG